MSRLFSALLLALGTLFFASPAWGYTIATGFSESCHERISISAFLSVDIPEEFKIDQDIAIPQSESWRKIGDALASATGITFQNDPQRLVVVSLALGARAPDTEGHSVANLASLREAHTNPSGQYAHFLRSTADDGNDEGNEAAIEGSRKHFRDILQIALAYTRFPTDAQLITTTFYLDFHGRIDVEVWAPVFYLGIAMHALQDSFSHTVRSDDLRKIRHVMNYIDAIQTSHEPSRDGIAHSDAMDDCHDTAKEIAAVAQEATGELIVTMASAMSTDNLDPIDDFMDKWFAYEPGCTQSNNFCDSKWSSLAQTDPTGPFIADFFACTLVDISRAPRQWPVALWIVLGMALWIRQRRRGTT